MNGPRSGYYSVIGASLLHPISCLWSQLNKMPVKVPNKVQTATNENGYSISLIILQIALTESIINRTMAIMLDKNKIDKDDNNCNAINFIKKTFPNFAFSNELLECWILRDVILHNHIWESEIESDYEGELVFVKEPAPKDGIKFGDKKYFNNVDMNLRKTKTLGLNIFPPRIWRRDATEVFNYCFSLLEYLEEQERTYCYLSVQPVEFNGQRIRFAGMAALIRENNKLEEL